MSGHDRVNKYKTELAVSVIVVWLPRFFAESNMFDELNSKLGYTSGHPTPTPTPIVICEEYKGATPNEFYVQARDQVCHERLLHLDGTNLVIGHDRLRLRIRNHSRNGNDERPLKRHKSSTSIASDNTCNKTLSIQTSPHKATTSNNKIYRQVVLHTRPSGHTPESFLVYMNQTLKTINMSNSDDVRILACCEVQDSFRDWVLEMKTKEDADQIMNMSGKQVVEGTRLYFKRHPNYNKVASSACKKEVNSVQGTKNYEATRRSPSAYSRKEKPTWKTKSCGSTNTTSTNDKKSSPSSTSKVLDIASRLIYLYHKDTLDLTQATSFMNKSMVDRGFSDHHVIVRTKVCELERIESSILQLETDTEDAASKLIKLSGIKHQGTELILKNNIEAKINWSSDRSPKIDDSYGDRVCLKNNRKSYQDSRRAAHVSHPKTNTFTTTKATSVVRNVSLAENEEITRLKEENEKIRKDMFKILKSNVIVKTQSASGSVDQPIKLDNPDDEEEACSSKRFGKKEYDELKINYEKVVAELEKSRAKSKEKEKELDSARISNNELESQIDVVKNNLANAEHSQDEIHKSWQDQHKEISQQKDIIDSLKSEQLKEIAEHQLELQDKDKEYQNSTKALADATCMLKEERESRREMMNTFANEKDAHKKTKKQLKGILKSAAAKVKTENDFDA